MTRMSMLAAGAAVATVTVAGVLAAPANATSQAAFHSRHVCATASVGYAACSALVRTDANGKPLATGGPSGYGPTDLRAAYHLTTNATGTVAIVDAYDDPTAESDLNVYRSQFGLGACTTSNGCFKKINQSGGTAYPRANGGWAQEISLDLDMVSAICPGCHILLVEASSSSFANLATAVSYAGGYGGVVAISNSYGGTESSSDTTYQGNYVTPAENGIAVVASTGDNGYGAQSPAAISEVVAVGGTHLTKSGTTYSETAWSGAGSGCSAYHSKPVYQSAATQCGNKALADVSAVADPNTGVSVYDSTRYQGMGGWMVFGGTSVSSPIIASVYALAAATAPLAKGTLAGSLPWAKPSALNDVTSGSNGSCSTRVWCNAGTGWDGPTGLGTPNGTGAF